MYVPKWFYDNSIGRFITEDPIKDGLNWYVYCGGNPVMFVDPSGLWAADGSDERFKQNNPIVYAALSDLTQTWINLDNLERQGVDIGNMKNEVAELANEVRKIGDTIKVESTSILGQNVNDTEAVIYYSNKLKGLKVVSAAVSASFPGMLNRDYKDDGTVHNAIKHATWNAEATILTNDVDYVRKFTNAHEYGEPIVTSDSEIYKHTKMDIYNNSVGRNAGYQALQETRDKELAIRIANGDIISKAYSGKLSVVIK